ncbi:arylesterase [Bauldia sp.]|uniref:arylesterase n=1 Tax=Bauldia sp. TaxID=2575872 RepID=UPI003BA9B53F
MPVHPLAFVIAMSALIVAPAASAEPLKIIALGDSLTAGFGVDPEAAFPAQLERALQERGHDIVILNGGVSGDTASDGLARVDWAIDDTADAVIVELGANDALRAVDPAITRDALDKLLARLTDERGLPVLLVGMMAPRNLDAEYTNAFDSIYPDLAERYDTLFYPFFLDGVATDATLNQDDGIHPRAEGYAVIVERMLPSVEALIEQVRKENQAGALQLPEQQTILSMIRDGGSPCRACSPASKSPPRSASDWPSSVAGSRAPAG